MAEERAVKVPDIGDFDQVEVIEILVSAGDTVSVEQSLITLESDKATMEIPSPVAGVVKEVAVSVGDQVSEGSPIATLTLAEGASESSEGDDEARSEASAETKEARSEASAETKEAEAEASAKEEKTAASSDDDSSSEAANAKKASEPAEAGPAQMLTEAPGLESRPTPRASRSHATPSVRRLARDLGVDLAQVVGTGRKGRIQKEDVEGFVKKALAEGAAKAPGPSGFAVPEMPAIDFSKWGPVDHQPLNKLRRVSARNLHRAWLTVPHVTQFDEADITELEEFRQQKKGEAKERGLSLTPLGFFLKACAVTLQDFPQVNSSLAPDGESLIVKDYFHIGIAVDTERGLVVPVIRDVDKKGLFDLAEELATVSQKARDRKLRPEDLQGGTFSISSLGGIGGTAFTPIVNAPEVAILGVSRASQQPVWNEETESFQPRLIVPLSFSYDHRVIDGADAVRFTTRLKAVLSDIRNLIL